MSHHRPRPTQYMHDSHDFGNDGDGEGDRGMTESSSGFVTSDNELTDEHEGYADGGSYGGSKYAYAVEQEADEGHEATRSSDPSVYVQPSLERGKRPTRKSSSKNLFLTAFSSSTRKSSSSSTGGSSIKQKLFIAALTILGLFLLGTIIVLSTIQRYFHIDDWAYLSESEIGGWQDGDGDTGMRGLIPPLKDLDVGNSTAVGQARWNQTKGADEDNVWGPNGKGTGGYWMRQDWDGQVQDTQSWNRLYNVSSRSGERIPRIIHQTWKSDVLPEKWRKIWMECREGMPDYEYMLWTDEQSRRFIAEHYPQFLSMFDGYEYPIQRADAIRYFILHHFGGIYMDLDIGCRRRLEPLISGDWDVLLPRTKPVGVSNDLIFSAKRHPFMEATIHGLIAFDHRYVTNYPTVMFSTGPMFLSAQYGLYSSAHPLTPTHPRPQIRILPKSLYGKNAKPEEAPHSFFAHYYGSSWHSDDAGFITFLGTSGKLLMYIGMAVFILGGLRYFLVRRSGKGVRSGKRGLRRLIVGDIIGGAGARGGTSNDGSGAYHMVSLLPTSSASASRAVTPSSAHSDDETITSEGTEDGRAQVILDAVRRAGNFILAAPATLLTSNSSRRTNGGETNNHRSGVLYFLPAFFAPLSASETTAAAAGGSGRLGRRARTASMASMLPSSRTSRAAGGRRSRQSSYAQSRLESGDYQPQQQHYHHPQPHSLANGAVHEEDERQALHPAPPPYETATTMTNEHGAEDPTMAEVDLFLKSQE
ncbi:hypothetical protein QFC19_004547 [Naganishia cerealis]|uniref:Uncharacterized protein n=1 Tax=Naganishia cerealis TaxID=610337 RepID=A0ACC2VVV4_9TREE|nr:hypothetical protein QFC19_004547 [Naganishia cerealis]